MKLQSPHLADYLTCTPIIDWETPAIIAQTQAITRSLTCDTEKARALFEWVRDTIPHSWDMRTDVVTCTASEVLQQRTGLCYAKSHLLAAMLPVYGPSCRLLLSGLSAQSPLPWVGLTRAQWRVPSQSGAVGAGRCARKHGHH